MKRIVTISTKILSGIGKAQRSKVRKTMREFIITLTAAALLFSGIVLVFADGSSLKSGIFTYEISGDNVTITGVDDTEGEVTVPEKIDERTVTAIGDGAFGGSAQITEVNIPDTVTSIGTMCFAYSTSIRTVRLSKSITSVGEGMFYQCSALSGVAVPYGVTEIGSRAFAMCSSLTAVTIPNSMANIADDAFADSPSVRFYCNRSDGAVGYTYAQSKWIDCEELITVYVNGNEIVFDQPPITEPKKFRTLVPLRAVLEYMGAEIEWFNDMNYAGIDLGGHRILIRPGSEFMMVDGKAVTMTCPAVEYNNRVLLPIRDVVEAVGGKIKWEEYSKSVYVTY